MRNAMYTLAALATMAAALPAQERRPAIELRPLIGASIPTGRQRDLYPEKLYLGMQAAFEIRPAFHVVGTLGWTPSEARYATDASEVDILDYNVGVELGLVRPMNRGWEFRPFLGLGAGARSYDFLSEQLRDRACLAGYGALGTEFQLGRTALRFEARDNVFCYKAPVGSQGSRTRSDIMLALGVAYHFR